MSDALDERMMRRCLELAGKAAGRTSPNPMVAAVLIDSQGSLISEGYHSKAGEPHAEVLALNAAGNRARGATLYVNLEPCSHHGRTPPCADRVIESGVARVVAGMKDPNPLVFGEGIAKIRAAGIEVELAVLEEECLDFNRAFVKRIKTGLPWLTLKMAASLDGRIADRHGESRWISGPEARAYVHNLRNVYDSVLVGGSTAVKDDPQLNVRGVEGGRNPHRIVIDPSLRILPSARLCKHEEGDLSWTAIFCDEEKLEQAPSFPARVKLVPYSRGAGGLRNALRFIAEQGVLSVLCEGGGRLAAALLNDGLVDEIHWIAAPKLFCDALSVPALAGEIEVSVADCFELDKVKYEQLGRDVLITGRARKTQR